MLTQLADAGDVQRLGMVQVLAGDPNADVEERAALAALGYRSLLPRLPVSCEDLVVGALEAYSVDERPWSRFEIRRARMIAHQLGAAVERGGAARVAAGRVAARRGSSSPYRTTRSARRCRRRAPRGEPPRATPAAERRE